MVLRTIRLMPEDECEFPVWVPGSDLAPESVADEELREDVMEWNQIFLDSFSAEHGWASEQSRARFSAMAPGLAERLTAHFGPHVTVVADLWPL